MRLGTKTTASRAVAYAALVALSLLQLAYASHDAQHVLGDIAETCDVCVQLDQPGSTAVEPIQAVKQLAPGTFVAQVRAADRERKPENLPLTRAPPFV